MTCSRFRECVSITDLTVLVPHAGLQAGADVGVSPHVHGLFLTPQELSIGVAPQLPLYQVKGEGHQLQMHTHTQMSWDVCRCVNALYQVNREGHQLHTDTDTDTVTCLRHISLYRLGIRSKGVSTKCAETLWRESDTYTETYAQTHIITCRYKH